MATTVHADAVNIVLHTVIMYLYDGDVVSYFILPLLFFYVMSPAKLQVVVVCFFLNISI